MIKKKEITGWAVVLSHGNIAVVVRDDAKNYKDNSLAIFESKIGANRFSSLLVGLGFRKIIKVKITPP